MKTKKTPHIKLLNDDVLNLSVTVISDMLSLESAPNAEYSDRAIVRHILNAASSKSSISNVSNVCDDAPCEGTIRYRLGDIDIDELQENLNETLKIHGIKTISSKSIDLAIDYTHIPYYGKEKNEGDTVKTKPKQGTSRYFTYATAYVILKNKRYNLAVKYIRKGDSLTETVDFLIKEIESTRFKINTLFLDREFYNIKMINYLLNREIPFIMPCVKRGKSGGIRKLMVGRKSYSTNYTMHSKDSEATFQVNIVVKYSKGKYKQHGTKHFAYATNKTDISFKKIFKEYRKRFGIETNYRLMNQARIHTNTKKPELRLLYIGIALLLTNIWIYIQWTQLSIPRQGGRQKVTWTLKTMLKQINQATNEKLGFNNQITIKKTTKNNKKTTTPAKNFPKNL